MWEAKTASNDEIVAGKVQERKKYENSSNPTPVEPLNKVRKGEKYHSVKSGKGKRGS